MTPAKELQTLELVTRAQQQGLMPKLAAVEAMEPRSAPRSLVAELRRLGGLNMALEEMPLASMLR